MKKLLVLITIMNLIYGVTPSFAGIGGRSVNPLVVSTASWAVVANEVGKPVTNSPYTIIWTVNRGTAYNFFTLKNIGTTKINEFEINISQSQIGGSGKINKMTIELCRNGTWDPATNSCSSNDVVSIATEITSKLIFNLTNNLSSGLNINSEISLRARTGPNLQNTYTTTLSTSVSRNQIHSATGSNS